MKYVHRRLFGLLAAGFVLTLGGGTAVAGGLVDTSLEQFLATDFTTDPSANITNPWWTLPAGHNFLYFSETEDGCEWNLVEVLNATTSGFSNDYAGTDARIILDRSWLDEECDYDNFADVWGNLDTEESTYDWYAQDSDKNIWYMGEDTWDGENHDGSFTAGCAENWEGEAADENARAGIVLQGDPAKGEFYQQEYLEDEAEDWGKVVNFVHLDGMECLKTKEWSPLEHGYVEHKFYCHDDPEGPGELSLINELHGRTVVQELIDRDVDPVPPGPTAPILSTPQCPPYSGP